MAEPRRKSSLPVVKRTVALVSVVLALIGASVAFAVQPKADAVYKGTEPGCKSQPGYTCAFLFRVSANGGTMTFVAGHNVVGMWRCNGGGGEAILGPYKKPAQGQPVPSVRIAPNGTFTGTQAFGSGQARGSVVATGRFNATRTSGTIEFTLNPGSRACVTGPVNLSLG